MAFLILSSYRAVRGFSYLEPVEHIESIDKLDELSMILSGLASNMPAGKTVSGKDLVDAFSGLRMGQLVLRPTQPP